jgi:hypothetical protein
LNSRKVCSRSNRRRNDCQHRSISAAVAPMVEDHSRLRVTIAGQVIDVEPDQGALDDR